MLSFSWIYAFAGLTGALWVLVSGVLAGLGGGDGGDAGGADALDALPDGDAQIAVPLDAEHAVDVSLDSLDQGHAAGDVQPGFPFLSPYVLSAFLAGFGTIGYALLGAGFTIFIHLPGALATGLSLGGITGLFYHKLRTTWSGSSQARRRHLLGATAEVSVSIPAGKVGEVMLIAAGTRRTLAARNMNDEALPTGTKVQIERLDGSRAIVREHTGDRLDRLSRSGS